MAVPRILIVSEGGGSSAAVSSTLSSLGYQIFLADVAAAALDLFKENFYALVIMDLRGEDVSGLGALDQIWDQQANIACILLAEPSSGATSDAAQEKRIRRIVAKPVDVDELIEAVEEVLCADSLKFDHKYPNAPTVEVGPGQLVRGERPTWCEVCGYSTHWFHHQLVRHFCSEACVEQYQGNRCAD